MQYFIQSPSAAKHAQNGNHHDTQGGGHGGESARQIKPGSMRKAKHQKGVEENGGPMRGIWFLPPARLKYKGQHHHDQGGHGGHPKRQGEGWQRNGGSAQHLCAQGPSACRHQGQQHAKRFAREVGDFVPKQKKYPKRSGKHTTPSALRQLIVKDKRTDQGREDGHGVTQNG